MNSAQALPNRDLFFRLADHLQLEACVQAVAEGKTVVLHSASAGLLDHYGQILVQRLRQRLPETPTEIFFPTHADALIARFNEVLLNVSVDAATQPPSGEPPAKLWVVHDASALPEHELKLMARLLQHLPGARVSAVLMLQGAAPALRALDPQGRRLLRWDIEPPTPEQSEQMVHEARQIGREFAALELVARIAPPPAKAPAALPSLAAAPETLRAEPRADEAPPAPAHRPRRLGAAISLGLALLGLSVGVAAWLHPDTVRQLGQQLQQQLAPAPQAISGPVSPASEALPAASATPEASEASAPASAAAATDAASEASASASAAVAATASPVASAPEPAAPSPAKLVTELPDVAQKGLLWLRQLDKDAWVIEHARHASVQTARKQVGSGVLTNARIVPVQRAGSEMAEFAVIIGPFRSAERARQFASRNALPASATIHATPAMLALTPAASATAPAAAPRSRP